MWFFLNLLLKINQLNLQAILNKTKSYFISVSDAEGNIVDSVEKEPFNLKKEITSGGNFFLKSGSDFFTKVLNEKDLELVTLASQDTSILFIKNTSQELLFSIYSKNEINPNITKLIIDKYDRNN